MRQPDYIIKIAADSAAQLRRSDVDRILENCSDDELAPTAAWIIAQRPDLATKVEDEMEYQDDNRRAANSTIF